MILYGECVSLDGRILIRWLKGIVEMVIVVRRGDGWEVIWVELRGQGGMSLRDGQGRMGGSSPWKKF